MKLAFIGGGNMGEVILASVLSRKLSNPQSIAVSDVDWAKRAHLERKYTVSVVSDNVSVLNGADIVVLAIKPQNLEAVMKEIAGQLKQEQLVISIIAGKSIKTLTEGLKHCCIVRSMPNTPAQIGDGMTVWTTTKDVTAQQKEWAKSILGVMGVEIYVDDEKFLDMATAVSGSGPAYVFLFVEAMTAAAVRIGVPQDMAEKLVLQTLTGAAHLIPKSGITPAELRKKVTSPGGTTAEAIAAFEKGGFAELVATAVRAAYEKAKKLGS